MKKFKGTKGNWFVSGKNEIISMPTHCKIAKVGGLTIEQTKENAKLLVCAPELLEELEHSLKLLKCVTSEATKTAIKRIELLIKKATE